MRAPLATVCLACALVPGAQGGEPQAQVFVNEGLAGTGTLAAGTVDFLGDTLGSFSSMQLQPGSWKRRGDAWQGILWTLPDRGLNQPEAGLFYDYASRLHRFRVRFTPRDGVFEMVPDGGFVLRDFRGQRFTGADPGAGTLVERGIVLPSPRSGVGAGKVSLDAESLQFRRDGSFYVGDEYAANVYYFDRRGRLRGVILPPPAVEPRRDGQADFGSMRAPQTGRRNNQGVEGVSLSPDGRTLFVVLQSALVQDSASVNASGRVNTRVLVYDVARSAVPPAPVAHYVVQLPAYNADGAGPPDSTAAQSEIRALNDRQFLMLSRDSAGVGSAGDKPAVFKRILLVDVRGATNLAGTEYETSTVSVLAAPDGVALKEGIVPASWEPLVDLLDAEQLARVGLNPDQLSEKWEALDLVPVADPGRPNDYFLLVGNDNDFIARRCVMTGERCDAPIDNDNRVLVYRLTLP